MTKDKDLEELFLVSRPQFTDGDAFMATLAKRLDAVEYVRQQQAATLHRYRVAMAAAFVVGIASGIAVAVLLLATPADVPLFTLRVQSGLFVWLAGCWRPAIVTLFSLLLTLGVAGVTSGILDLLRMRMRPGAGIISSSGR